MRRSPRIWLAAVLLLLSWSAPASAQVDVDSVAPLYGTALVATAVVLLVICWPAKRSDPPQE
jgi:hypothetical protein